MPPEIKTIVICLMLCGSAFCDDNVSKVARWEFSEAHMGTRFRMALYASDRATANEASSAAYAKIALLNRPMCILNRISALSYFVMSRLLTIPHIGLANIVAGEAVVRELLQDQAQPQAIAGELFRILDEPDYRRQIETGLARVRENLGSGKARENVHSQCLRLFTQPAA